MSGPEAVDPRSLAERHAEVVAAMWPVAPSGLRLSCDSPVWDEEVEVERVLTITGWALSGAGTPTLSLRIDGVALPVGVGMERLDVMADFPEPGARESGWEVAVALAPGPRRVARIDVEARDPDGRSATLTRYVAVDPDRGYQRWLAERGASAGRTGTIGGAELLVWVCGPRDEAEAAASDLGGQTWTRWRRVDAPDLRAALRAAATDPYSQLVVLEPDVRLDPTALQLIAERVSHNRRDVLYLDEDVDEGGRRHSPRFKPGWSPERLLAEDVVGGLVAVSGRAAALALAADPSPVLGVYDLVLRLIDCEVWAEHVPEVLVRRTSPPAPPTTTPPEVEAALARRGRAIVRQVGPGRRLVSWPASRSKRISVIIPTARRHGRILTALRSLASTAGHADLEVVVLDESDEGPDELQAALGAVELRHVPVTGPFNYSHRNNVGVSVATGEVLVFANDDIEMRTEGWASLVLGQLEQPGVGMVGVLMLYPRGSINHAGVAFDRRMEPAQLLGCSMIPGVGVPFADPAIARECLAVGTAFAALRRVDFEAVGGFDNELVMEFGDLDLSLQVQSQLGLRVVYTPAVEITHHERGTRGSSVWPADEARFWQRWERLGIEGDPYWNLNLHVRSQGELLRPPPQWPELVLASNRIWEDVAPVRPIPSSHEPVPAEVKALERFVPALYAGTELHAEHEARYRAVAPLAPGRAVLDAGCGTGWGSVLLAVAGAAEVHGVDIDPQAIWDARRISQQPSPAFHIADLVALPFPDASFDLITCFEVIEHVGTQREVVRELRRVLRPGGCLAISSPNPGVSMAGNPYHVHELTPEALAALVAAEFDQVATHLQVAWHATSILPSSDEDDIGGSLGAEVRRVAEGSPPVYSLVLGGDGPLPTLAGSVLLSPLAVDSWSDLRQQKVEEVLRHLEAQIVRLTDENERLQGLLDGERS